MTGPKVLSPEQVVENLTEHWEDDKETLEALVGVTGEDISTVLQWLIWRSVVTQGTTLQQGIGMMMGRQRSPLELLD